MPSKEEGSEINVNTPDGVTDYKRPNWDDYFFKIMKAIAERGTCSRGRSGCVIAKDNQLVSAGYVGSPIGEDHCDDVGHLFQKRYDANGNYSLHCVRTVHAEQNAICQAAKRGISIDGATLYCQMTPCPVCAKMIINSGIERVVCLNRYHDGDDAERLFLRAGIALEHISEETENYGDIGNKNVSSDHSKSDEVESSQTSNINNNLKVRIVSQSAHLPNYAYEGDAGLDLYADEEIELPAGSRAKVPTGIALEIPEGHVGLIWDRSGVPLKKGLKVVGGVIDPGYRGEIYIGMANISRESVLITKGEKIAQLLVQKVERPNIEVVEELEESERGERAFGSSDEEVKDDEPNKVDDLLEEIDYLPDEVEEDYEEEDFSVIEDINEEEGEDDVKSRW